MSRCFPLPPRCSSKIGVDGALIESIKLQRGWGNTKEATKKDRKEKKGVRTDRSKYTTIDTAHEKADQINGKVHKGKKRVVGLKGEYVEKKREAKVEQRERSNLTEEHGQAVSLHTPCNSADSTENSNKRRRTVSSTGNQTCSTVNLTSSSAVNNSRRNVIRIKLSSWKGKDASICNELPNSSSEKVQLSSRILKGADASINKDLGNSSSKRIQLSSRMLKGEDASLNKELVKSSSERLLNQHNKQTNSDALPSAPGEAQNLSLLHDLPSIPRESENLAQNPIESEMQKLANQYNELVVDIPAPLPVLAHLPTLDDGSDDDWLFTRKHECRPKERSHERFDGIDLHGRSSRLGVCAQYLPDAGVYALPYAMPF